MRLVSVLLVALAALVATTNAQFSGLTFTPYTSNAINRGTAYTFTWTQPATTTSVYLRVCTDTTCSSPSVIVDTAGPFSVSGTTGSLTYTCRARINERVYYIQVSDAAAPTTNRDYVTRTISPAISSFTWTYPSAQMQLPRLTPITFAWTTVGAVYSVDLTLTSGSTLIVVGRNITNTGSYTWTPTGDVPLFGFIPTLFSNVTDGSMNPINKAGSQITIQYPSITVAMTSMTSAITMSPGSSQVLSWTVTPSNLILSWNISLLYGDTVVEMVARGLTTTSFRFTASYPERSYYLLRLIPFQVDASLAGYKLPNKVGSSDTATITISKSADTSGGGGGGGSGAGIGAGAVFILAVIAFGGYKRWQKRQERRAFAKMQGIANDANNPPPPPVVEDQYVTEGIPLCYFSNPNYAPPGAQPAVLIPVVSPVGHVVGLVPQH